MLQSLKNYLEKIQITPTSWLVGVSCIFFIRFFLEGFSSKTADPLFFSDFSTILHYYLFFLGFALVFIIFIQKFVPFFKKVAPQLTAVSLLAIFIAPITDWFISKGEGFVMAYLIEKPSPMLFSLISFFGKNLSVGITIGMRVEILIILFVVGLIVYLTEKKISKIILAVISLYLIIFIFVSLPGFVSVILQFGKNLYEPIVFFQNSIINSSTISNNLPSYLKYNSALTALNIAFNYIMARIFLILSLIFASIFFILNFKEKFKAIIKNSRPERVAHYIFLVFLGIFSAYSIYPDIRLNWNDWFSILNLCLAFYLSWMFAVCVNDIEDTSIDEVTNKGRPLIEKTLSEADMKQVSNLFLVGSLIAGYLCGYGPFFFLLSFTALYYVYSAPPTRFKLIPFFSSFLIGLCCLAAVLAGFFMISPDKNIEVFPDRMALAIVMIYFLWSHVRDMKDIEGDRIANVNTVPVIFGDIWGPRVVGIFGALAFLLVPIFSKIDILFVSALPAALLTYYFVNKKPYTERPVFVVYTIFISGSIFVLLF